MSYTKAKIFNLALGALLLQRQISNTETDPSNEAKTLNTNWDTALSSTLEDLDLDSLSEDVTLELVTTNPNDDWLYAYAYPTNCAFFRRIKSCVLTDSRKTQILKRVGLLNGDKVIFTNQVDAVAQIIPNDLDLTLFDANTALAVAFRLAILSSPLVVGKGAQKLREEIEKNYIVAKAKATEKDHRENFNYTQEDVESEFVSARIE